MKYFKLIKDQQIVGAASSNNFIYYSPVVDCYLRTTEEHGEYISFQNKLYRDTWMSPTKLPEKYISVQVTEITEEEYNIFMQAIQHDEVIIEEEDTEQPNYNEEQLIPDDGSVDFVRQSKLSEMSYQCRKTIENGVDVSIKGEVHHFSLTTQDQLNLMSLGVMAQTQEMIPYHADGETCTFYTAEEINQIVTAATAHKIYHTTYYNSLKNYINSLNTIEEIAAITYGVELPEEYQSDVLKSLQA